MIVNDRENGRTLDQETGVYLTSKGGGGAESIWYFTLVDGGTEIHFSALKRVERSEGVTTMSYILNADPIFVGQPRRAGYRQLVEAFLAPYEDHAGWRAGKSTKRTKIDMRSKFMSMLADWEVDYVASR